MNVRSVALDLLIEIEKNKAFSNIVLNKAIDENRFKAVDAGLLTEIVYGTLQRKLTLDYYLSKFVQKKIDLWVRNLLRLSLYQMIYLDKIPAHAILNEAVEIAKQRGHAGIASFVNGVLRNVQRQGIADLTEIEDPAEQLATATSHPLWLVEKWVAELGFEETKLVCEANLKAPIQTARVNTFKSDRDQVLALLAEEGFKATASHILPECIENERGNLAFSGAHRDGLITIQDVSSMLVANVLAPESGERILDACAAPGGKATHLLEKLNGTGEVFALDIHRHKLKLVEKAAKRLGLQGLQMKQLDARKAADDFPENSFDRILVDAPCSGFGVLRRKPEAKYEKTAQDIARLSDIQLDILDKVSGLLKPAGTLVYSTCTINKNENEQVVAKFLENHPEFEADTAMIQRLPEEIRPYVKDAGLQLLPHHIDSDGFFITVLRKRGSQ